MRTKPLIFVGITVVVVIAIAAASFDRGRRYEANRGTVIIANEGCFVSWSGLMALNNCTDHAATSDWGQRLDSEMDLDAMILADMALKHPNLVGASQYQLLRNIRDFRKKYGRHYDYMKGYQPSPTDVDLRIDKALACLEFIHGTNSGYYWPGSEDAYLQEPVDNAKHGN